MNTRDPLAKYKERAHRSFRALLKEPSPDVAIPADPKEALLLGMKLGRYEGYKVGLKDGTELGMDVAELIPFSISPVGEA